MMILVALVSAGVLAVILGLTLREERHVERANRPTGTVAAVWDGPERRQHPRYRFSCPLRYRQSVTGTTHSLTHARVWNVSSGGLALRLPERLARGTQLEFEVVWQSQGQPFCGRGEVMWSRELRRLHVLAPRVFLTGLKFREVSPNELTTLHQLLTTAQLNAQPSAQGNGA